MAKALTPAKSIEWTALEQQDALAVDLNQVETVLDTGDLSPLWPQVREMELQSFRDNFTSSATADGRPWPPRKHQTADGWGNAILAPSGVERKGDDGHPLLMDTGALMQAVTGGGAGHITRMQTRILETGVDKTVDQGGIPGAQVHDLGDPDRNIPERQFHEIRETYLVQIDAVLADGILGML